MTKQRMAGQPRSQFSSLRKAWAGSVLICAALCCSPAVRTQSVEPALPNGNGNQLVAFTCSQCHGLREITILRDGSKGWQDTVDRMVLYGAQLSPSEADLVTRYLTTQFGPRTSPAFSTGNELAPPVIIALAEGAGKDLVQQRCAQCHSLEKVVTTRRSPSDWDSVVSDMERRGMQATPDEVKLMLSYLMTHYSR